MVARQCPACGLECDIASGACPQCGEKLVQPRPSLPWLAALAYAAIVTSVMWAFHFPRPMIVFFGLASLVLTGLSLHLRRSARANPRPKARALTPQPTSVAVLSLAIGILGLAFLACGLFGFVVWMNAHDAVERVQGQPYHATMFEVVRSYYQKSPGMHGPEISIYASGMVEGQKECMSLIPYLKRVPNHARMPRNQGELDEAIPPGTVIPVYLLPGLEGRSRIEVIGDLPPGDSDRRTEQWVLRRAPVALAVLGGLIFLLIKVRRSHIASGMQAMSAVPG